MSEILSNNRLQALTTLKDKKGRERSGKVILEGLRLMNQLALYGVLPFEVFHAKGFDLQSLSFISSAAKRGLACFECKDYQLKRFCDTDSPPKVAGLYPLPQESQPVFQKAFYLDGISDPGNMGTIFRLCKAFGIDAILLSEGCAELSSPKVIRASLGAVYSLPFGYVSASELEPDKYQIIGTDALAEQSLEQFTLPQDKAALIVLGSEAHGMSDAIRKRCVQNLKIKMQQTSESVNVSIAAGIIAHYLFSH